MVHDRIGLMVKRKSKTIRQKDNGGDFVETSFLFQGFFVFGNILKMEMKKKKN